MTIKEYADQLGGYSRILQDKEYLYSADNKYKSFIAVLKYYIDDWYLIYKDYNIKGFRLEDKELRVILRNKQGIERILYIDEEYVIPGE